jgi:hypothetical protein
MHSQFPEEKRCWGGCMSKYRMDKKLTGFLPPFPRFGIRIVIL